MRILLIESWVSGHHQAYLQRLVDAAIANGNEVKLVVPTAGKETDFSGANKECIDFVRNGRVQYGSWMREIINVAADFRPDVIHFVYGDDLYRYFGAGIGLLRKKAKIIVTFHQIRRSFLRDISLKMISRQSDRVIVHTEKLKDELVNIGIRNVEQIEYPQFSKISSIKREEALAQLGIEVSEEPILLALGGTREDKGIDILLKALQGVTAPFHLIVGGKEEYFGREYLEEQSLSYKEQITIILRYLSEEEMAACLNAADILVLPYRRTFDGASGPLGEGVWLKKQIVGPDHGSLGQLIRDYQLGRVFEAENIMDLRKVLEEVLNEAQSESWTTNQCYEAYRDKLDPAFFEQCYLAVYEN